LCFEERIFVLLSSKKARQNIAVQDDPRDLETGLLESQIPNLVRQSDTMAHQWTSKDAQPLNFGTKIGFILSSGKRKRLSLWNALV
jgi:hypothetical protein